MNNAQLISGSWIEKFNVLAFTAIVTFVIHRFGLLSTAMVLFVDNVVSNVPLTVDVSLWWSAYAMLTLAMVLALLAFTYAAARTGEPLFGGGIAD